jgi:hypothetical protein
MIYRVHDLVAVGKYSTLSMTISYFTIERGLGLVACLEGQKINNMPNLASIGSFPTFLKLFVQPETQQL